MHFPQQRKPLKQEKLINEITTQHFFKICLKIFLQVYGKYSCRSRALLLYFSEERVRRSMSYVISKILIASFY